MTQPVGPLPSFDPACPMSTFPIQIGGKWTAMIMLCLQDGPRRFGVLRRHLRPISTKVLTETLGLMGRDGLVRRRPVAGADDGGVEYELTTLGRSLLGVVEHARAWARDHAEELAHARAWARDHAEELAHARAWARDHADELAHARDDAQRAG